MLSLTSRFSRPALSLAVAFAAGGMFTAEAFAANYTWVWPANVTSGNWSDRVGGAGTNLKYWKRDGAVTAVLPGPNDAVTINSPPAGVTAYPYFDGTGFAGGTIALTFRSFKINDRNIFQINHNAAVTALFIQATAGNIELTQTDVLNYATIRADQIQNVNSEGCDVTLQATGSVLMKGSVRGGAPKGTGSRGGDVKLISTAANGTGIQVTGYILGGAGKDNTSARGGNVILQALTSDIDGCRSSRWIWGGRGANNLTGDVGGPGGSVTFLTTKDVSLGVAGEIAAGYVFGGNGGSGKKTGGAGGPVFIGQGINKPRHLSVDFAPFVAGGDGGPTTLAMNPNNTPVDANGGAGGDTIVSITGNLVSDAVFRGGTGGSCAKDNANDAISRSRGKGGAGGQLFITAASLVNDLHGSMGGGNGGGHDYAGPGGKLTITTSGDFTNYGSMYGGDAYFNFTDETMRARLFDAARNADGGTIEITSTAGKVKNTRKNGATNTAGLYGGRGGDSTQNANGGYRGGHVKVTCPADSFQNGDKGKAIIRAGDGGSPRGAGGQPFLNGKRMEKLGYIEKARNGDGKETAMATVIHGTELVQLMPGDEVQGREVQISVNNGGLFVAVQDPVFGHGKVIATDLISVDTGCTGFIDLSAIEAENPYGPAFISVPDSADDQGDVVFSNQVSFGDETPSMVVIGDLTFGNGNAADFNGDGFIDFFDLDAFIACFEGDYCEPGRTADFNNDAFIDFFDLDGFVSAYESGGC